MAAALEIPYYVMNFRKEFQENVIDYFIGEYLQGRTPNPCIACNRYVKWESLLTRSLADRSGLYRNRPLCQNRPASQRAVQPEAFRRQRAKDQTYALYSLTQEQLASYPDAGGRLYQGSDPQHGTGSGTSGCRQTGQSGYLFCAGRRLCLVYRRADGRGKPSGEFCHSRTGR